METIQQENAQEAVQENGAQVANEIPRVAQIVPPKEVLDEIEELELQYRQSLIPKANEPV